LGAMPDFWTSTLQDRFHQAVKTLHSVTDKPCDEAAYRSQPSDEDGSQHKLRFRHELQIVDHIAYLAHSQQGVESISAACVEEHTDGLVVRIASNHTPTKETVTGLNRILNTIKQGVIDKRPRQILREQIFEDVLFLSKNRILQRIQPPWVQMPSYFRGNGSGPLSDRLNAVLNKFEPPESQRPDFWHPLRGMVSRFRELDDVTDDAAVTKLLQTLSKQCAEISHHDKSGSLECQIKAIPTISSLASAREIAEIDKISRYYSLCDDLSRIALSPRYRALLKDLRLEVLTAYPAIRPRCASKDCFVHAEVQVILYYEQHPPNYPPPRAIGGSKSACFLCDLLIQKVGKYRISYTHRRLYPQWTIPASLWMSDEQRATFSNIVEAMIVDIESLTEKARAERPIRRHQLSDRYLADYDEYH
ncbi:hypothetical protein jhhlp_008531, partial [Lomentospora prolificans]